MPQNVLKTHVKLRVCSRFVVCKEGYKGLNKRTTKCLKTKGVQLIYVTKQISQLNNLILVKIKLKYFNISIDFYGRKSG